MSQRVLIVDDSPFIRRILSDWLKEQPDFEVVGTAANGAIGVQMALDLKPDLITMDVEMPVCDGLSALQQIMAKRPTPVLMVSSVTRSGAEQTMKALELGAVDFVTKPNGGSSIRFLEAKDELLAKLRGLRGAKLTSKSGTLRKVKSFAAAGSDKIVLIASSTGGPKALATLFESFPEKFPAPIVMVQHMPVGFTASLANRLTHISGIPVREAKAGDQIVPSEALMAPAGHHLSFDSSGRVVLEDTPLVHGVRPAADIMFTSAAEVFGSRCIGVVLTGMGRDGATGAFDIHNAGGVVFGEDESTCVVYGMPKAAKDAGGIVAEFPIEDMARAISGALTTGARRVS